YWGAPIPIVYCNDCGIVPVSEKDLPVLLPAKVEFGIGNPLETNEKFVNVKCPKCGRKARRETDTMDTFFDSSWYFLRFCDPQNSKKPFDFNRAMYWNPVDFYTGGAEHAVMHLMYARFFTKALRDLGFIEMDEPFTRLFNQGMIHGEDGFVMSKSRGNVVNPIDMIEKYGADALRLALVSFASPDKDTNWDENVLNGNFKFLRKLFSYFNAVKKFSKSDERMDSKINRAVKNVTDFIESMKYNYAIIEIRNLFNSFPDQTSRENLEKFLKLISPFCPHIAEEFWEKMGNKNFISVSSWPKADESRINEGFEMEEKIVERLAEDIKSVKNLISKREKPGAAYVYVIPNEKKVFEDNLDNLEKKTQIHVKIYSVSDKDKHDPLGKSKKAKPGKPAIYLE
ncbi:MAG: class I tRNA ligase family protein, partial [Candidatus Pacearchaeota archaeon]|nr:class I tRNA ligase family protein [Candidatus Pacearchaeota archaeon]